MTLRRNQKILVVACDAGGAEVIAAYIAEARTHTRYTVFVNGPAEKIFRRHKISIETLAKKEGLKKFFSKHKEAAVLLGTSGPHSIEFAALREARRQGMKTFAYLDSWINYRERFGYPARNWRKNLPDEIWVGDTAARRLAKRYFSGTRIKLVPNRYLAAVVARYKARKKRADKDILFMSAAGVISEKLLRDFLHMCARHGVLDSVRVRLHPEDDPARFKRILKQFGRVHAELSQKTDIVDDLALASVVVGPETVALVPAHMVGIKTIRIVPRGEKAFLPFPRIRKVRDAEGAVRLIFRKA